MYNSNSNLSLVDEQFVVILTIDIMQLGIDYS